MATSTATSFLAAKDISFPLRYRAVVMSPRTTDVDTTTSADGKEDQPLPTLSDAERCIEEPPSPGQLVIRIHAAGICHSDAHYRAGTGTLGDGVVVLGHEVAGEVVAIGLRDGDDASTSFAIGDRVCLHYLATCGECRHCHRGSEQFCRRGEMLGKDRQGGYQEYTTHPARACFRIPTSMSYAHAAVMMCSSATSLHALHKARMQALDTVAIWGMGGLGQSALQLALAMGARHCYCVDINQGKLDAIDREYNGNGSGNGSGRVTCVNAAKCDPVAEIHTATSDSDGDSGVDVSLELIGLVKTMEQAVQCLGVQGRCAIAGLSRKPIAIAPYTQLLAKEAEVIGVSDHLAQEIPQLIAFSQQGHLVLDDGTIASDGSKSDSSSSSSSSSKSDSSSTGGRGVISRRIPLQANLITAALDNLDAFGDGIRTVIEM